MAVNLGDLNKISGVKGSYIYSMGGELLLTKLTARDERIEGIGYDIAICAVALQKLGQEGNILEFVFANQSIITRVGENFFVVAICDNSADTTLVRLSLNVLAEEVKTDKELQGLIRKAQKKGDILASVNDMELQELFKKMKIVG